MFPSVHTPVFTEAPLDCAVDFGIHDTMLVTTVTCLNLPDHNPLEHALSQLKNHAQITINGKNVQIVDKVVVETVIPSLVELKRSLGQTDALCSDFNRKYLAIFA